MLKKDLDLEIYDFGSLLAEVFNETGWVNNYEKIIAGYTIKKDLSIEELSKQLMGISKNYYFFMTSP